jgi:hypothetical protein
MCFLSRVLCEEVAGDDLVAKRQALGAGRIPHLVSDSLNPLRRLAKSRCHAVLPLRVLYFP